MDSQKMTGGIAQFDLKEFEWYGDDPNTAGSRQALVRQRMRDTAITWRCDYLVAYVTADDLFSVSPIPGRHKVWSENISPVFDITNVIVRQRIKPEMYNNVSLENKEYALDRAKEMVEDKIQGLTRNNNLVIMYEIWCGDTLITKGGVA